MRRSWRRLVRTATEFTPPIPTMFPPCRQALYPIRVRHLRGTSLGHSSSRAVELPSNILELAQGEGGWNTEKLATVHGREAADELIGSVERNLKFRDTHNKVVENSQTAQRQAAAAAMKPGRPSETPMVNPNATLSGMGLTGIKKALVLSTMR